LNWIHGVKSQVSECLSIYDRGLFRTISADLDSRKWKFLMIDGQ